MNYSALSMNQAVTELLFSSIQAYLKQDVFDTSIGDV